ncbi:hypothetical protein ACTXT7_001378 [Hymenolepis weldensis]
MENCQLKPIPSKLAKNCRGELFLITKPEKCPPRLGSLFGLSFEICACTFSKSFNGLDQTSNFGITA